MGARVADLLDQLHARGIELVTDGRRLGVLPRGSVTPEEQEVLRQHRVELVAWLLRDRYKVVLRRWWGLAAQGPEADREAIATTYQEIVKLMDEVGEPTAMAFRRQWGRQWWEETGTCPWCGERGPYHAPGDEVLAPCYVCHGLDWWRSRHGKLVCRRCHPPVPGAEASP